MRPQEMSWSLSRRLRADGHVLTIGIHIRGQKWLGCLLDCTACLPSDACTGLPDFGRALCFHRRALLRLAALAVSAEIQGRAGGMRSRACCRYAVWSCFNNKAAATSSSRRTDSVLHAGA